MSLAIEPQSVLQEREGSAQRDHIPALLPTEPNVPVPLAPAVPQHSFLQAFQSLLYVITVALFIITFVAQPFRIPSDSMVPTLLVGDFLLVEKQVGREPPITPYAPLNTIRRGDLIVFHYPVDPSLHLVKRVVALPGDRIHLQDGHVILNGSAVPEPYAIFRPAPPDSFRDQFPHLTTVSPDVDSRWWIQMRALIAGRDLVVPPGKYFVLGDNRNDSEDSRYWGLVPQSAIVGKPLLVYFSLNDPSPVLGQRSAASLTGVPEASRRSALHAASHFFRWDRALHVLR